jgi:aldehyde:ferredoxin oxidoreductase
MLPTYYVYRDYDPETGFPSERKLKQLGLENVAKDLKPYREKYKAMGKKAGK